MPVTGDDASAHHKQTTLMSDEIQSPIVRFGLSLGVLLCFLSVPVSGYFLTQIVIQARASHDWPSVEGQLLRAQVGGNGAHGFHADVSYRYEVNGQIYNGQRVRTSDGEYKIRDGAKQAIRGLVAGNGLQSTMIRSTHQNQCWNLAQAIRSTRCLVSRSSSW